MNAHNVHIFCMVDPLFLLVGVRLRDSLVEAIVHQDLDDHTVPLPILEHDLRHGVACCSANVGGGVNTMPIFTTVVQYAVSLRLVIALRQRFIPYDAHQCIWHRPVVCSVCGGFREP
jgi:hypothetical protein